jgi:uncharacterized protein YcaQ
VPADRTLSIADARRLAIGAQGLGKPRAGKPVTRADLRKAIESLRVVQLDAINVVERTQFFVLFSRLGAYDPALVHTLTKPRGPLFEYWGHMASIQPVAVQPLLRWRMELPSPYGTSALFRERRAKFNKEHREYIKMVLAEVQERGPLRARELSDPRRRNGEWWDRRSVGRVVLEHLFFEGELSGWRNERFERVYDVPERVLPAAVLDTPTPDPHDAQRSLYLQAARAIGVGTVADLANYWYVVPRDAKPRILELVENGDLVTVNVDGWREPAYTLPNARVPRLSRETATLLSPFDSLIWFRARTERLFGFDYKIEVYVPAPKRKYGYYVFPVLLGDQLVGRLDVKADRKTATLRVVASYAEPGVNPDAVAGPVAAELDALRHWLGLEHTAVGRRGDFAKALAASCARFR